MPRDGSTDPSIFGGYRPEDVPTLFEPGAPLSFAEPVYEFLLDLWAILEVLAVPLTILFLIGVIYSTLRINQILDEDRAERGAEERAVQEEAEEGVRNRRWQHVTDLMDSRSESDWRLAILEADVMLEELVESLGYHGDSLGEKLKQVERSDFTTIDSAWEAHKIRNTIAHEGSNYTLNEREAKRVIALFEDVFREFELI